MLLLLFQETSPGVTFVLGGADEEEDDSELQLWSSTNY